MGCALSMWENMIEADGKTMKRFEYVGESYKPHELAEAHRALLSTLNKCEKIDSEKWGNRNERCLNGGLPH